MTIYDVAFRAIEERDFESVGQLWFESWLSTGVADPHATREALTERLRREDWTALVALVDAEIVGFLAFDARQAWLRQLFVKPSRQRCGIGLKLLQVAKARMPGGFRLNVQADNLAALRFYEYMGLTRTERCPTPTKIEFVWF